MAPLSASDKLRRTGDARTSGLARRFGDALRVGDAGLAEGVIDDALEIGLAPEAIQTLVIEPAMTRIGELWESRYISVADEHLATSISHRALIRLFEVLSANRVRKRTDGPVLLAAVEGQHHVLGLRMVADVLEGAGFDVLYLGGDVPVASLREFTAQHRPSVAGLAFGIAVEVSCLANSLWAIHESAPEVRIMLGGRAVPPGLNDAGYPCVANSMEVLGAVETLLASPPLALPEVVELLRSNGDTEGWPRETEGEKDAVAGRLAEAAEGAVDLARKHVRRAETYRGLALRDPLTDLPNRRAFEDELIARAGHAEANGMVLMIDVDSFKAVNDELGHEAGDRLLRSVAETINGSIRPGDLAARVGGDEFAAILPEASPRVAQETGERVCKAVASCVTPPVTVSVGVAELSGDARRSLLAADTALYEAKAGGRNRVAVSGESS